MANLTREEAKKAKKIKNTVLASWKGLNAFLMLKSTDSAACNKLLKEELAGRKRPTFVERIRSRFVKLRNIEERKKLRI